MKAKEKVSRDDITKLCEYANEELGLSMGETFDLLATSVVVLLAWHGHRTKEDLQYNMSVEAIGKNKGETQTMYLYAGTEEMVPMNEVMLDMPENKYVN